MKNLTAKTIRQQGNKAHNDIVSARRRVGTTGPRAHDPTDRLFTIVYEGISPWRRHQELLSSAQGHRNIHSPHRTIERPLQSRKEDEARGSLGQRTSRVERAGSQGKYSMIQVGNEWARPSSQLVTSDHKSGPCWFPRLPARRVAMPTRGLVDGNRGFN
ncbi:hypothetical protein N7462_009571 [Penicillium macrosclerotiorum]|uniref:uncharacterized protein n=1 Tax=Penicillium macrosclerotiorum TaxID=303699 RepID=UPI0025476A08|nr:uncharacterized protein N7462_009571 [Penicillium macrosclerotiorum]KAJ5674132.1 hypothetical protein N7462_009571 [Penicillium macrosclerotiorum]